MSCAVEVDADYEKALAQFKDAAEKAGAPWLIVGAAARILLLEKIYGFERGLATEDVDFAVQVESWAHYEQLCNVFAKHEGVEALQKPAKRFRAAGNRLFDLLPYDGVETDGQKVYWPPDNDYLMTVRGFRGARDAAITVRVNDRFDVLVASPAGLLALKLFAWEERASQHPGRDAKDIAYLLEHAERMIPASVIYEDFTALPKQFDYDLALAAIAAMSRKVADLLSDDEQEFLHAFLRDEIEKGEASALGRELAKYSQRTAGDAMKRLAALESGLVEQGW